MQTSFVNHGTSHPLSPTELAAWRGFLRVHSALVRDLDAEVRASHGLSLHEYEVLLYLSDSADGRLRMSDLAAAVLLSQSGLTRLVDRLVRAGSVERMRCEDDRRGHYAALTPAGRARFEAARTVHRAGVRARFLDRLGEDELRTLAAVWERLVPGATAE
jgi:DNA-binding MarR family transcriptional regulator